MKRPAVVDNSQSAATRERIVEASLTLFSKRGFEGVSTRDIGEKASCNIATLNYHFGSKAKVYDAAFDEVYRRLRASLAEVINVVAQRPPEIKSLRQILEFAMPRVYESLWKQREGIRFILREILENGKLPERVDQSNEHADLAGPVEAFANLLGMQPLRVRRAMVSGGFLLTRYITQDESALARQLGVSTSFEAHQVAIRSLVEAMEIWINDATDAKT